MRPAVTVALDAALREVKDMLKSETDAGKKTNMISLVTVLTVIRRDWDSAASNRVKDIEMLSGILKKGTDLVQEPLRQTLIKAVKQAQQNRNDIRISSLDATLNKLKEVLIDLQKSLETNPTVEGKALQEEIFSFLILRANRLAMLKKMW